MCCAGIYTNRTTVLRQSCEGAVRARASALVRALARWQRTTRVIRHVQSDVGSGECRRQLPSSVRPDGHFSV